MAIDFSTLDLLCHSVASGYGGSDSAFTLGAASTALGIPSRAVPAAMDGETVDYFAFYSTTEYEIGTGAYTHSGTTVARADVDISLSSNSNNRVAFSGAPTLVVQPLSGRMLQIIDTLLDLETGTAAGARSALGLGTIATQAASSVSITGGSVAGITDLAVADGGTGSSTAAAARTALGLESESIDGALISITADDAISVSAGRVEAENGDLIHWTSAITATGLSLSTSTMYYVYVYLSGATPTLDVSTTVPVVYQGTARSKTGATGYRYLGYLLTDGSADLFRYSHQQNNIVLFEIAPNSTFRMLSMGKAIITDSEASKIFSAASITPPGTTVILARMINFRVTKSSCYVYFASASATLTTGTAALHSIDVAAYNATPTPSVEVNPDRVSWMSINSSREGKYAWASSPTSWSGTYGAVVDLYGLILQR